MFEKKRKIVLLFYCLGILLILIGILSVGYKKTFDLFLLPTMNIPLADLPRARVDAYPSIWGNLANLFNLGNNINFFFFVFLIYTAFFISCYSLLSKYPSFLLLILYFSGSSLILIERGNIDLIIFVIIFIASTNNFFVSISLISLASLLKIYPIFAFLAFLNEEKKTIICISILILLLIIYLYPEANYILIQLQNLIYGTHSFGSKAIAVATLRYNNYLDDRVISIVLFFCSSLVIFFKKTSSKLKIIKATRQQETLFLCGSLIFIGCFVITSNYDHRLIFLLLCVPYLIKLDYKPLKYIIYSSLIIGMNSFLFSSLLGEIGFRINLLSKIFLFIILLSITLIILKKKIIKF
jgi:hypothetical protein